MRKTKIVCTIGPASEDKDTLRQMMEMGMNIARLNFSHGIHAEHKKRIETIRTTALENNKTIAIMLDTKGPEIRTGKLQNGRIYLESGQTFTLTTRDIVGDETQVSVNYSNLPQEIAKDTEILLADGIIRLQVEQIENTDIMCRVLSGGELTDKKGINIPGARIKLPFLSEKDIEDINFGIDNKVDFIAASFVRTADDVLQIKRLLEQREANIDIIAKIESQEGVDNLEDIIQIADGVMVARGDLGVEIPAEDVPLVQKTIVEKCSLAGKVVIIATQMLESMMVNPRPTRAEVSDIANAVFDGADAIMLSGETAAGKYPVEVVRTMARIATRTEQVLPYTEILRRRRVHGVLSVTDAISFATCATALNLGASAIITATTTGLTAKMVAKYRPQADIVAATPRPEILNKLAIVWGVNPVLIPETEGTDSLFEESVKQAIQNEYVKNGDLVVLTAGVPTGISGTTNLLKVHLIGEILLEGIGLGKETVKGKARIVINPEDAEKINPGDIVVTTSAESFLAPYLSIISALIAEEGGLTSNAAVMGLNARIPVLVGAANCTSVLKDNMLITLDTPAGRVYRGMANL
ncbi:MAG: pyruvate kinase [Syntrophomonadaceae bacterium]